MAETAMKGLSGSLENLSMSLSLYGDLDDDENEYAQPQAAGQFARLSQPFNLYLAFS
ncbi:hypothetical protein HMEPL2_35760 [Vreelandella aquamarina]|uniref:Uncharacterized protein n=1 Tax=Vreelandella aquamarina TaxID=77097 RepID=A0A6F8XHD4_9GAMM|nr:hypothetical protein HMEPL2_35760 [Halomonas meridiana]